MPDVTGENACPDVAQQDFNFFNRFIGMVFFLFYALYFPATCFWWWTRRHHPWLRKRHFDFMVISGIGIWCEIAVAPFGNFTGRREFPCDAHLWLTFFIIPLAAGPLIARLILIYNASRYNKVLATESIFSDGYKARLLHGGNFSETVRAVVSLLFFQFGRIDSLFSLDRTNSSKSLRKDIGHIGPFRMGEPSSTNGSEDSLARERKHSIIIALHWMTRKSFGYLVLFFFVFISLVSIAIKYADPDLPFGKGCKGCHLGHGDIATMGVLIFFVVLSGTWMLYKVRDEPDPLMMISEIKLMLSCGLVVVAGTILSVIDIADLRVDGKFDWVNLCVIASIIIHTVHCPLQVYRTYEQSSPARPQQVLSVMIPPGSRMERDFQDGASIASPPHIEDEESVAPSTFTESAVTLERILSTRPGRRIFKKYLATEYAVENLYFIDAVDRFRENYDLMQPEELSATANDIYRSFVKEGGMLEVNLSGLNKRELLRELGNPSNQVPPRTIFDDCRDEVYGLMENDSFPRFLRSEFFKQWLMPALAV